MNWVHTISSFKQKVFDLMGIESSIRKNKAGSPKHAKKGKDEST